MVSTSENDPNLDKKELEKLYLEIIGQAEDLIENGKLFRLKEDYERSFTSLATAAIEAKVKKAESHSNLVTAFLLKITALNPDPPEMGARRWTRSVDCGNSQQARSYKRG